MAAVVAHGGLRDPWGKPHGHQSQLVRRPKCMTWREADVRADDGQTIVHNGMVMHSKKWGSNMKAFIYATPPPFLGRPESTEALGHLPLGHEFQVLEFKDCTHYVSVRFFDRELPPWRNTGWINVWKRKQAGACRENDLGLMICYPCGGRGGRQRWQGRQRWRGDDGSGGRGGGSGGGSWENWGNWGIGGWGGGNGGGRRAVGNGGDSGSERVLLGGEGGALAHQESPGGEGARGSGGDRASTEPQAEQAAEKGVDYFELLGDRRALRQGNRPSVNDSAPRPSFWQRLSFARLFQ